MSIPKDYAERVYAGVLGKIIGVYLGRPFEGWSYERISSELGEVNYYVHEALGHPLIVTDDDISGTFIFLRALQDYGSTRQITSAQIGQTWLNYVIENRTTFWWGGLGNSTEHTAYLRLKNGVLAPQSGSTALNGQTSAEQIGAQIFIDGWAMVAPGDPELAVELAGKAARVSHDGEAVYAAQLLAAMQSQAFIEPDIEQLLDTGLRFIPKESTIYRMVMELREWSIAVPDWRQARLKVARDYGYHRYPGNCHVVPNHALIHLGLLYGEDDFQKTLMIVNTSGWDTDCNSGNVGCLMGIKNGLAGIDHGPGWRDPVADQLYISSADGSKGISDAVSEAYNIVNIGRKLANFETIDIKNGARFHFEMPGSLQGFRVESFAETHKTLRVYNVKKQSRLGVHSLAFDYQSLAPGKVARAGTATFIQPDVGEMPPYKLAVTPSLHSGQEIRAEVKADSTNEHSVVCGIFIRYYDGDDKQCITRGPLVNLKPGIREEIVWSPQGLDQAIIYTVGLEIRSTQPTHGKLYLDYLSWDGVPEKTFNRPSQSGQLWHTSWVDAVDKWDRERREPFYLTHTEGTGLLIQGCRDWRDYQVEAEITPHLVRSAGIAAYVQGMRRYYALLLCQDQKVRLVKELDGRTILAEADFRWDAEKTYPLRLCVTGGELQASIGSDLVLRDSISDSLLDCGAIALVCEEGHISCGEVRIKPN